MTSYMVHFRSSVCYPDVKVDTRYVGNYIDPAKGKELAESMINDNKCDIVWGVAGNSGNGAAEAAQETGKAYFIGVDSDQEQTLSTELAAITLTSGLKNVGQSLVWVFDELDAGNEYWGQHVTLGINEGGVGIVTDKNFTTTPQAVQDAVNKQSKKYLQAQLQFLQLSVMSQVLLSS